MPAYLCTACGIQHPISDEPPPVCILCQDERRAIPREEQRWTSQHSLRHTHFNAFRRLAPGLMGIATMPVFALGQRALLVRTPAGNVLWDCPSFLDDATIVIISALGGVAAIAASCPPSYGAAVEWSHALGSPPVYVHAADRKFVTRSDPVVTYWEDEAATILPELTLLRCGGQYPGATLLHWAGGAAGEGALLCGASLRIARDGHVRFMRSYDNHVPLDPLSIRHIQAVLEPWAYEAIYGGWWDQVITNDGQKVMFASVERTIDSLTNPPIS